MHETAFYPHFNKLVITKTYCNRCIFLINEQVQNSSCVSITLQKAQKLPSVAKKFSQQFFEFCRMFILLNKLFLDWVLQFGQV